MSAPVTTLSFGFFHPTSCPVVYSMMRTGLCALLELRWYRMRNFMAAPPAADFETEMHPQLARRSCLGHDPRAARRGEPLPLAPKHGAQGIAKRVHHYHWRQHRIPHRSCERVTEQLQQQIAEW